jgi:hypothetical protein
MFTTKRSPEVGDALSLDVEEELDCGCKPSQAGQLDSRFLMIPVGKSVDDQQFKRYNSLEEAMANTFAGNQHCQKYVVILSHSYMI